MAAQYFKNENKAKDFLGFCEKRRKVIKRPGLKHTKPRVGKRVPKVKRKTVSKKRVPKPVRGYL